ncbi:MAG TPA: hypothetical protein VMV04_08805 [Thermodesulfobacteriota bacterium]|jgi:hypothetical protein|nr:hypothetical protein [Thermodesulfobacteriota bacterium]
MKKIVCLIAVVLMIASVAFAAAQKKMITEKDLAGLKGTWEGILDFGVTGGSGGAFATLEILNDTVPVKAKLTVQNIPQTIASTLAIMSDAIFEGDNGVITTQGTIVWSGSGGGFFEVSPRGDKKLNASYWFRGVKGNATLKKK